MKPIYMQRIIVLLSSIFLFNLTAAIAGDPLTDSLALVALYDSTNGSGWYNSSGWKTDTLGAWHGITLENGRVTEIRLNGNNLDGPIPPQIGGLDSLEVLWLNHNYKISGSIPAELGNLSKLEYLHLQDNKLTDSIPPEIGNLSNLINFYAGGNDLTGNIPSEIGNLTNLQDLYLANNLFKGSIPVTIGNLSSLVYLRMSYNDLTGGIPDELANLTKLTLLELNGNPLGDTIPSQLGNMSNLHTLCLVSCQLEGSIPVSLTNLTNLQRLELSNNNLTDSIPSSFGSIPNLQILNVYNNQLSGEIPPELGNLSNLQQLSLSTNNFTGIIPTELAYLSNLQYLELYGNELTGSIPPELGNLTNLRNFLVSDNQLTGGIPPELGNLTSLSNFFIQNNKLSGPMPEGLASLSKLERIYINGNHLEDLPDFSSLTSITHFYVDYNKFTFDDLEPNIHILDGYSPQDSIGTSDTLYFAVADTLMLVTTTDGLYNNYQWMFNGIDISDNSLYSGTNDSLLIIMNPYIADTGAYACKVTNDTVTGLTLYRHPIYLLPTIKVTSLPEVTQCADDSITISFKSAGVFPGNVYTVELSDSLGSFNKSTIIASITSTDSIMTMKAYIPDSIPTGDQYRVRVNSSNPAIIGIPSAGTIEIVNRILSNPVVLPSADSSFCDGESLLLTTNSLISLQYVWFKDDIAIAGATTNTYEVTESGTYHVEIFDYCNPDSLPSNMVTITVYPLPIIDLSLDGTVLTATQDADYIYIWYLDGDELPVANTEYQYTALENGEYWVVVTDENGCSETSNSQIVTSIVGIKHALHSMDIFPIPTDGKVNITLDKCIEIRRLTIINIAGEIVLDQAYNLQRADENLVIDLSNQIPGIYIISIHTNVESMYFKLVKQ